MNCVCCDTALTGSLEPEFKCFKLKCGHFLHSVSFVINRLAWKLFLIEKIISALTASVLFYKDFMPQILQKIQLQCKGSEISGSNWKDRLFSKLKTQCKKLQALCYLFKEPYTR